MKHRQLLAMMLLGLGGWCSPVAAMQADEMPSPTVGAWGRIEGLLLPGSELIVRPIVDERTPIVLRIEKAYPHGNAGYRYDLAFFGTVPGTHDLRDYLQRADGESTADLPEISVEVRSQLPAGQVEPHPLSEPALWRLGGYRFLATIAVLLWLWVLVGLLLLGWRRRQLPAAEKRPPSLAELLRPRLEAALANRLQPEQYAELERMLFAYWRRRLGLESAAPDEAIRRIRDDAVAGPVVRQLEFWMHSPHRDPSFDLGTLLRPLEHLSAEDFGSPVNTQRQPVGSAKSVGGGAAS